MPQAPRDISEFVPGLRFGTTARILNIVLANPAFHVGVGLGILVLDVITGPDLRFPTLFAVPVVLCAWFSRVDLAYGLAVALPLGRLGIASYIDDPTSPTANLVNAVVRMAVLAFLVFLLAQVLRMSAEIKVLRGMLPTCMYCKRIRNEDDTWEPMEGYVSRHTDARFGQGLCPECMATHHRQPLEVE